MKLKFLVVLAAIITASGWQIEAQTNTASVTNATPIVTTNVWTAMPFYREVNGQVYDPSHSALWEHLSGLTEVKEILPDAVVLQRCEERQMLDSRGWVKAVNRVYGKKFMLKNLSLQIVTAGPNGWEPVGNLSVGSEYELQNSVAMYVGTTNYNGEVLPLWDYGKEVTSQTVTIVTTNYPPQAKNKN